MHTDYQQKKSYVEITESACPPFLSS